MSSLEIMGWGQVCPAGGGIDGLVAALGSPPPAVDVSAMYDASANYDAALPSPRAHVVVDFDVVAELGRKGTSFFDRRTALTVVGCGHALRDADLKVTEDNRHRIGVVLGTTAGSIKSSVDYAVDTFTQDPPYLVNPALFPNTVMNCAAGQSAIWFGLNGINATVAGGRMAFLSALRYCASAFRSRQADYLLAGAVEEFTPHTAWLSRLERGGARPAGEGGAVFVLRPADDEVTTLHRPDGEVLGVSIGFCPGGADRAEATAGCVRAALRQSGADPGRIRFAATGGDDGEETGPAGWLAIRDALGHSRVEQLRVAGVTGDNPTAASALELAAVLALHRHDPGLDGRESILVAGNPEGAVGAAVVRGWSRGADRG